ncbi:SDR family NAD(P)-dependent oxidoreductase [Actinomadura hibisca]|uniref:SDR family NAD(P)-dependent oxidoreductase n=1 Tax=Actinomadura hibisca TaxID=68565 RepID=UPI000A056AE9|nr:SDR family NAD(P)-dependent oxidoreductase [Actinomadura hibisca]
MRRDVLDLLLNPSWTVRERDLEQAVRGRTVLVTGASHGLGAAVAESLGRAGARVLLVARSADRLEEVAGRIREAGGQAHAHPADLCDPAAVEKLAAELLAAHGRIDVLVSNAGKSLRRSVALQTDRFHDFTRTIGVNYLGPVRLVLALLPSMREHGGHIVNVSTIGVRIFPGPRWGAYQASKGAFDVWLRSVAPEIRRDGVRVTTLYMALIYTRMSAPTPIMRRLPGLAPDQAAGIVHRAIIDRPRSIGPWWVGPAELLSLVTRAVQEPVLTAFHRWTRDTPSALGRQDGARPRGQHRPQRRTRASGALRTGRAAVPALRRAGVLGAVPPGRLLGMVGAVRANGMTLASLAAVAAARWPDRTAVADERGRLTYRQLQDRVGKLAGALRDGYGIGVGSTVAVLCRNHRGFVEAALAAARLGADLLPLNTEFAAPQLARTLAGHPADVVIADAEFAPVLDQAGAGRRVTAWTDEAVRGDTLDTLVARNRPAPPAPARPGRIVVLSSGTTGAPKGTSRTPSPLGLLGPAATAIDRLGLRSGEPILIAPPLFHGFGLIYLALALALGSPALLRRRFDAAGSLQVIADERAGALAAVPVMLQRIMELPEAERARHDTSCLRAVLTGGAPVRPATVTAFMDAFGDVLGNGYGSSEVGIATIASPADLRAAPGTVGRPVHGVPVRVLDGSGRPVPAGTTGRILVGGPMVADGQGGTGGLVDTGDLGHLDGAGRLFLDGRSDDMIVSGGENVFPQEVEDLLAAHPAVADAAVVGAPDPDFGQRLVAYVVPAAPGDGDGLPGLLKDHVKQQLARYKTPREIHLVDGIPRTPTGKTLRRLLQTDHT